MSLPRWLFLVAVLLGFTFSDVYSQTDQPNIIVIVTDDAGYADFGFQGSQLMKTPNFDQLRSEGTFFSNAYVTNSVCAPSRAGLITGRYQNRFGFEYNIVTYRPAPDRTLADVGLDPDEKTIADYLKPLGYSTAMIGKWHLGEETHHHPNSRGFDYFYGLLGGSRPYFSTSDLTKDKKLIRNNTVDDLTSGYMTDILTDDAISWMNTQIDASKPFFTYLSFTAVHGPYESKSEDLAQVGECSGCNSKRINLAAMTSNFDQNLGKLIQSLKDKGVYDNTLIFVINDNGGPDPNVVTDNGVLRGGKSSQFEGGLRVPMVMFWKNQVPQNLTYSDQVISMDITATAIKAAGGTLPNEKPLDGVDLLPVVQSPDLVAHEYLYWRKKWLWSVVRSGNQKMIVNYNNPETEVDNDTLLYDLSIDVSETQDIFREAGSMNPGNLIEALGNWESTLVLPDWIGDTIEDKICATSDYTECPLLQKEYFGIVPIVDFELEAEYGIKDGQTEIVETCATASEGAFIKFYQDAQNTLTFELQDINASGEYEMALYYYSGDVTKLNVSVNGKLSELSFPKSQWCYEGIGGKKIIDVALEKGSNTVVLSPVQDNPSPLVDKMELKLIKETLTILHSDSYPNKSFKIYPNPVTSELHFECEGQIISEIELADLAGHTVFKRSNPSNQVNLDGITSGLYLLKVKTRNGHSTIVKFLIDHE